MKNNRLTKKLINVIVSAALLLGAIVALIVLYFTKVIFDPSFLILIFAIVMILLGALLTAVTFMYLNEKKRLNDLLSSNNHHLGIDNFFYDFILFKERMKKIGARAKKGKSHFIVAFTAKNHLGQSIDEEEKILNGHVAEYISSLIHGETLLPKNKVAYCYHKDTFILAIFDALSKVNEFIDLIQEEINNIIKREDIHIFSHPYFGVCEVEEDSDLNDDVDKALLARDSAEHNFEDVAFYTEDMHEIFQKSEIIELRNAIHDNEFVVFYQPKFDLNKKEFIGAEALVRWDSPKYGFSAPAKFIKKMEYGGLIHELDMYVFKTVLKDLEEQKKTGKRMVPISINFSLHEFYSPQFLKDIKSIFDASPVNPKFIEIEITETTSQANIFLATSILKKLKEFGFRIAMDDFGVGFSNISHLNSLPIDVVKIDKSYIDGLGKEQKNKDVVKYLISLCKANGLEVVAEGVDSKEEVQILEKLSCDIIQGYFYSEPVPLKEFDNFLTKNSFEKKGANK